MVFYDFSPLAEVFNYSQNINISDLWVEILHWLSNHLISLKKVQVGKDQEKAQSEKNSHSKNRGGKRPN